MGGVNNSYAVDRSPGPRSHWRLDHYVARSTPLAHTVFATLATHSRCPDFVHRRQDSGEPLLHRRTHTWMREHIKFLLPDCPDHPGSNLRWVDAGLYALRYVREQGSSWASWLQPLPWAIARWSIALALRDVGAHIFWTQHAHANANGLELHRQSLRHADHGVLARPVRIEELTAHHAGHRCSVDNVTPFAVTHNVRQESADAVQNPHDIHVQHPPPILERNVVDTAMRPDTGIVADDMHISECLICCLGRMLYAARIGDITGNAAHPSQIVRAFDGRLQRIRLDIGEHDFHAHLHKGSTKGQANPARCTRDKSRLAGKLLHDVPLLFARRGCFAVNDPATPGSCHQPPSSMSASLAYSQPGNDGGMKSTWVHVPIGRLNATSRSDGSSAPKQTSKQGRRGANRARWSARRQRSQRRWLLSWKGGQRWRRSF